MAQKEGKPGQILIFRYRFTTRNGRVIYSAKPIPMWVWPNSKKQ